MLHLSATTSVQYTTATLNWVIQRFYLKLSEREAVEWQNLSIDSSIVQSQAVYPIKWPALTQLQAIDFITWSVFNQSQAIDFITWQIHSQPPLLPLLLFSEELDLIAYHRYMEHCRTLKYWESDESIIDTVFLFIHCVILELVHSLPNIFCMTQITEVWQAKSVCNYSYIGPSNFVKLHGK